MTPAEKLILTTAQALWQWHMNKCPRWTRDRKTTSTHVPGEVVAIFRLAGPFAALRRAHELAKQPPHKFPGWGTGPHLPLAAAYAILYPDQQPPH